MTATHQLDHDKRIITTRWDGAINEEALQHALIEYYQRFRNNPVYIDYDEIMIMVNSENVNMSSASVLRTVQLAAELGKHQHNITYFAVVANSFLAYAFARIYEAYRNLVPANRKIVKTFHTHTDALQWLSEKRKPVSLVVVKDTV